MTHRILIYVDPSCELCDSLQANELQTKARAALSAMTADVTHAISVSTRGMNGIPRNICDGSPTQNVQSWAQKYPLVPHWSAVAHSHSVGTHHYYDRDSNKRPYIGFYTPTCSPHVKEARYGFDNRGLINILAMENLLLKRITDNKQVIHSILWLDPFNYLSGKLPDPSHSYLAQAARDAWATMCNHQRYAVNLHGNTRVITL